MWSEDFSPCTRLRCKFENLNYPGRFPSERMQILYCLQRRELIPKAILELSNDANTHNTTTERVEQSLFEVIAHLCSLRYAEFLPGADSSAILTLTLSVEESLEHWANNLPEDFRFIHGRENRQDALHGIYHVYKSFSIARIWNIYRCARLLANQVIIRCLTSISRLPSASFLSQLLKSQALLTSLCADICASVPCHAEPSSFRAASGHSLLWPLYAVATTTNVTAEMRRWVISQLREISFKTAILQGVALADVLTKKWEITKWNGIENGAEDDKFVDL
jgi:hypothetical protein